MLQECGRWIKLYSAISAATGCGPGSGIQNVLNLYRQWLEISADLSKYFTGTACKTLAALCMVAFATNASAEQPLSVWFGPAGGSPDLYNLFTQPGRWSEARKLLDGFVFSPGLVERPKPGQAAALTKLLAIDAFRQPKAWGLATALGVPSIKEWDCDGQRTQAVTLRMMKTIYDAGGTIKFLEMDEPLISALGINVPRCKLDIDSAARKVAAYAHSITTDPDVVASGSIPQIVDIEAYPSLSVEQMEAWILALKRNGFTPAAFHLDANVH
jgi:hypothetical protein